MSESDAAGTHRALVEALGDEDAVRSLDPLWLDEAGWTAAVDRVRAARFSALPEAEAYRAVGRHLGERYLASEAGQLVRESVRLMPPERLFLVLIPALAPRLRRRATLEWVPQPRGGALRFVGARGTAPEVTLGFFEAVVGLVPPANVSVARVEPELLELHVTW